jgi:glycosyltransferase involved in cell wall biosynthesis
MRILIASTAVPFVRGGAEALADSLMEALRQGGHEVDLLTLPFSRSPAEELANNIDAWCAIRLDRHWLQPDWVISLKFPAYCLPFERQSTWLLHQLREVYDQFSGSYAADDAAAPAVKARVEALDRRHLNSGRVHTIARTVSRRLHVSTGIDAPHLYHPPPDAPRFYSEPPLDFIFAPSRVESLKRQHLLVEAMAHVRTPVSAVISGTGTQLDALRSRVAQLGLQTRISLPGAISREHMLACYAHCLAVFFAPFDEDYGYVTLEAMLAERPVITCSDSGEPTEFVVAEETGSILAPDPREIADRIDRLHHDRHLARAQGRAGRARYLDLGIDWPSVVQKLLP